MKMNTERTLRIHLFGRLEVIIDNTTVRIPPRAQKLLVCMCLNDQWATGMEHSQIFRSALLKNGSNALHVLLRSIEGKRAGAFFERLARNEIRMRPEAVWIDYQNIRLAIRAYHDAQEEGHATKSLIGSLVRATQMMAEPLLDRSRELKSSAVVKAAAREIDHELCDAWTWATPPECAAYPDLEGVFRSLAVVAKRMRRGIPEHIKMSRDALNVSIRAGNSRQALLAIKAFAEEIANNGRLARLAEPLLSARVSLAEGLNTLIGPAESELPNFDEAGIVGRTAEVEKVWIKLSTEKRRLVSLIGEGGIGKTTVALMVGKKAQEGLRGEVWFVKLSSLDSPDRLASYVAGAMGIRFEAASAGNESNETPERKREKLAIDALAKHFTVRQRLLILDNCEHLHDAPGLLATDLLQRCPNLQILATSRRPLGLMNTEEPFSLPPLAYPSGATGDDGNLLTLESTRLFLRKAGISDADVGPRGDAFLSKLKQLVALLQGIPLCLVLAAARYKVTNDIEAILNDALHALSIQDPTLEPKERAVKDCIEWSERLLSEDAARLFYRLSVFYGGWDNRALLEVCIDKRKPGRETIVKAKHTDILAAQAELEKLFLISVDGERHRMNSVVRSYAFEKLKANGEAEKVLQAHATFYTELAEEQAPKILQREMIGAMTVLSVNSENVSRSFEWCRKNDATLGLGLAIGLWHYWVVKGLFSFGRATLDEFLALRPKAALALSPRALAGQAALAYFQSDYPTALDLSQRCFRRARKAHDKWAEVVGLGVAAVTLFHNPGPEDNRAAERRLALQYCDQGTHIADGQREAHWLQALAHSNRAFLLALTRDRSRDVRSLEREASAAVKAARRTGNEWIINVALTNEACAIWYSDPKRDHEYVLNLHREALSSRYRTGDRYGVLQTVGLIACVKCESRSSRKDDYRRAAILLGAQDGMQDRRGMPIPALNASLIASTRDMLRAKLGNEFIQFWSYGREKMTQANAVRFALEEQDIDLDRIAQSVGQP